MRKLLILALVLLSSALAFAYSDDGQVNLKESSGGLASNPVRVYTLVRYPQSDPIGAKLSAGDVVLWDTVSDDGVTVNVFGQAGSVDSVAGVVVSATILTQDGTGALSADTSLGFRNWGYIQIYGFNDNAKVKGSGTTTVSVTAGGPLCQDPNTARYAMLCTQAGIGASMPVFGFAYDAESSDNNSAEIFIRNR